jgi:hypothetical protein
VPVCLRSSEGWSIGASCRGATQTPITAAIAAPGFHVLRNAKARLIRAYDIGSTLVFSHPNWLHPSAGHGLALCHQKPGVPRQYQSVLSSSLLTKLCTSRLSFTSVVSFRWGLRRSSSYVLATAISHTGSEQSCRCQGSLLVGTVARLRPPPFKSCWRCFALSSTPTPTTRYAPSARSTAPSTSSYPLS